jgi:hypothetical protein
MPAQVMKITAGSKSYILAGSESKQTLPLPLSLREPACPLPNCERIAVAPPPTIRNPALTNLPYNDLQ